MDPAINGSYETYAYMMLLQLSLVYMQRPGLIRQVTTPATKVTTGTGLADSYLLFTRLIGSALS